MAYHSTDSSCSAREKERLKATIQGTPVLYLQREPISSTSTGMRMPKARRRKMRDTQGALVSRFFGRGAPPRLARDALATRAPPTTRAPPSRTRRSHHETPRVLRRSAQLPPHLDISYIDLHILNPVTPPANKNEIMTHRGNRGGGDSFSWR